MLTNLAGIPTDIKTDAPTDIKTDAPTETKTDAGDQRKQKPTFKKSDVMAPKRHTLGATTARNLNADLG